MNKDTQLIKEALESFSSKYGPAVIVPATVLSVDSDDTINVQLSGGEILADVRLRSIVKDGGKILLVPAINSVVQIARIENSNEYIVIAVSEVSKVLYIVGTATFDVDTHGFMLKNGVEDLLSLMSDLIDASVNAIYNTPGGPTAGMLPESIEIFNNIKARFNTLLKSN